jgi:membrane protein DedA with SNARE-associated domain
MKQMRKITALFLMATMLFAAASCTNKSEQTANPENKESMIEQVVTWYMDNVNYGTITLLMTLESTVIPIPSEMVVPPAVYKAMQEDSDLSVVLVILFATLGALIGSTINYTIALWLGRPIIYRFAESRFGKMCLVNEEKVKKAEDYFVRHGKASTFIGRLVLGVRHLISIPAGLSKMHYGTFLLYTALGAAIWNIILAALGYIAQDNADLIKTYSKELSYMLLALGVLFVLYLIYNGFFKKKKTD